MYINPTLRFFERVYHFLLSFGGNLQSIFLFWMRLTWGREFYLSGMGKLQAIEKTTIFFTSLNIPKPLFHAYLVGGIEAIGGFLLIIGFASRLISIPLALIMFAAFSVAHSQVFIDFHFVKEPLSLVAEAPYPFLITSLLVLLFGPGRISVDAFIKRWAERQPKF